MLFGRCLLMVDRRTLRNKTRLSSLGLSEDVVQQINQKISIAKKLREKFSNIEKDDSIVSADILFVNAEDKATMDYYAKCRSHVAAVPVFVYDQKVRAETQKQEAEAAAQKQEAEAEDQKPIEETEEQKPLTEEQAQAANLVKYPNAKNLRSPIALGRLSEALFGITSSKQVVSTEVTDTDHPQQSRITTNAFKILVVDDSFPVRKYLEKKLPELIAEVDNTIDFDIHFASSGRECVKKLKIARGDYDMVLLDIMMEDASGYQVCKWIKKVKRSINVVMLTSKSSPVDRVRANLSGCDSFISKPPKDSHLKKVILRHHKFQKKNPDALALHQRIEGIIK